MSKLENIADKSNEQLMAEARPQAPAIHRRSATIQFAQGEDTVDFVLSQMNVEMLAVAVAAQAAKVHGKH